MNHYRKRKIIRTAVLIGSAAVLGCTAFVQKKASYTERTDAEEGTVTAAGETEETASETSRIYVFVTGAVAVPGVYCLDQGARVYEAISSAGGLSEDAAGDRINQAGILSDGEQIRIPFEWEETETAAAVSEQDGLININTADAAGLMTLPGIGEAKAAAIIAFREENGPFAETSEIMNVSGIGEGLYDKIKEKIKV